MTFREATVKDIKQLQSIRCSVKENALSDPGRVTVAHYNEYLTTRGKGWVCEVEDAIVGFAIADLQENNIWALFLKPEFEGKGIGRRLHEQMLQWYFARGKEKVKFVLTREEWFKRSVQKTE